MTWKTINVGDLFSEALAGFGIKSLLLATLVLALMSCEGYGLDSVKEQVSKLTLEREHLKITATIAHPASVKYCNLDVEVENNTPYTFGILELNTHPLLQISLWNRRDGSKCQLTEKGKLMMKSQHFGKASFRKVLPGKAASISFVTPDFFEVKPGNWFFSFEISLMAESDGPTPKNITKTFQIKQLEFDIVE